MKTKMKLFAATMIIAATDIGSSRSRPASKLESDIAAPANYT